MPAVGSAPERCDIAVVGAGIVGLAVARELQRRYPRQAVCVLERDDRIAAHQTSHNSGVIHAGVYYAPGSLKARLCREGARQMREFCESRGLPVQACGKLIIATGPEELPRLDDLEHRARANGVPGLRRLGPDGIREIEPHCAGVAALHSPSTGITDFAAVARALADEVGAVHLGCGVTGVQPRSRSIVLRHARGETEARFAVFCAGAWSDRLAVRAGAGADPRIVPFRGAYLRLSARSRGLVRALVYPVPDPSLPFLGVHLTRQLGGDVLIGPTALLAAARDGDVSRRLSARDLASAAAWPGTWRMLARWWRTGATEIRNRAWRPAFVREAARYLPGLTPADVEPAFAGVRAQAVARDGALVDDFVFADTDRALHVRNAPSPAATASLAIAGHIADRVGQRIEA